MNSHVTWKAASAAAEETDVIRLADVRRRFGETAALDGVTLTVRRGEILGIIGRSGAGKSTLIRCLNGLERPDSGTIEIEGREITGLGEADLQPLRRRIGMIFQHFNLLSAKTVEENVALPLKIEGWPKAKRLARAAELLELVGLSGKAKAYPSELSGGQKQRVGIARALAAKPALLLSDEATSALDPETTRSILTLLKDINRKLGLTILLITHEMEVVRGIADRVTVLDAGRVVEEGPVWQVFSRPQAETTRSLLSSIRPQLPAHIADKLTADVGGEAILGIDIAGPAATGPLFEGLSQEFPGGYRLNHGGVDHIQEQAVGRFFLAVPADKAASLASYVERLGAQVEVLGHVADHA
ncbi:methionine ABC transporter ATP-binding protein [Shinella curvata]|uniref:Methionine ABC transporter ATP-binding protein n=1 Tax=Shinella curvata TaxID=1817964 RepID=A0ABT8XFP0_9HYPH|nr:methionine ABC transporter ATP-binding protein [Shinella curvata]MCJ8052952.1 methionine ABC transporter ATP-binding protein [Shinella curvata]MDO6122283.1 methionine ABC transporter ATP-binding protein [Shinella curvata]